MSLGWYVVTREVGVTSSYSLLSGYLDQGIALALILKPTLAREYEHQAFIT